MKSSYGLIIYCKYVYMLELCNTYILNTCYDYKVSKLKIIIVLWISDIDIDITYIIVLPT